MAVNRKLSAPTTTASALKWTKEAVVDGNYVITFHLGKVRMSQRGLTEMDVTAAIGRAKRCAAYDTMAEHGGSCWRVFGPDNDGRQLGIGVETYVDEGQQAVILITAFEEKKK